MITVTITHSTPREAREAANMATHLRLLWKDTKYRYALMVKPEEPDITNTDKLISNKGKYCDNIKSTCQEGYCITCDKWHGDL